ncbi:phosphopantetheine-binding protein [Solwaraspora sp. WMMD791]|uniref:acyl carrier protein n=1 Tax=Solwaraspora sp. WMMD791 TaxID=3016086 RepID=UPI00249B22DC|nr:phosphopantetheine-binding protein [Solwaraspora sp. WMMD791]WFE30060.1 phosphopantetheine-binding protein [Solwaraspora sp. WMMD791]
MDDVRLRRRVADLVSDATGGDVAAEQVLGGGSLVALGLDSLGLLRLVDAIESEFGVEVEFDGADRPVDTVDDLVEAVRAAG